MPESTKDRPTTAHEYLFLMTKRKKYYYDGDAIKEPCSEDSHTVGDAEKFPSGWSMEQGRHRKIPQGNYGRKEFTPDQGGGGNGFKGHSGNTRADGFVYTMRQKRSVWEICTQACPGAHFATYPEKLVEPCVLAGTKAGDLVLDPFGGSGTTGRVALGLGRNAVLIEINPDYIKLMKERCTVTLGFQF